MKLNFIIKVKNLKKIHQYVGGVGIELNVFSGKSSNMRKI